MLVDVTSLTLIMWASGGYRSGIPILILIALAGAGLVGQGRMVLFFAAYATVAVLLENMFPAAVGRETVDFTVGITCIGFFAIAQVARSAGAAGHRQRENLARQRGVDLVSQLRPQPPDHPGRWDGVLVVGEGGVVRQFNPRRWRCWGRAARGRNPRRTRPGPGARTPAPGRARRFGPQPACRRQRQDAAGRFLPAGEANDAGHLEDFDRIHRQIQQVKLAALGRLTASIAHEIRNPLASVYQAAELLREEKRGDMQARLIRIIGNNAQRIDRLVADVLALGRRDEALPRRCRWPEFVDEFLGEEFDVAERGARGGGESRAAGTRDSMDRTHLRQILWESRRQCPSSRAAAGLLR